MENCAQHLADMAALKTDNARIMERLDKLEAKMDDTNNMIREFIAAAPGKFASKDEFISQQKEIERAKGALGIMWWIVSTLGVSGIIAVVKALKFF